MKKWAIPLAAAAVIAVVAIAGAAFALTDSGDDAGPGVSRDADDRGESGGDGSGGDVAGICLEGAIDCDDTIDRPIDPGVCIQIFPTPPECADPDRPVSDEPPPVDAPAQIPCDANTPDCEKAAVALATEDLARRLGSADGITIKSAEFVQWPDACLGVSQPDVACAEVITYGYRIVLEADGEIYAYHTDGGSRAVLVN
jgi:hypothetical protein